MAIEPEVKQFRYYGVGNSKNFPIEDNKWIKVNSDSSLSEDLLSNYGAAIKIGVQTLPGVKLYLGNNSLSNGIIIDHTGVYELDLRNTTTSIGSLYFSVESLNRISEIENASLIVDVLCNPLNGTVTS